MSHPASVAATFALCIEQARQLNPTSLEILSLCAFLHPDAIPLELFSASGADLGPDLQNLLANVPYRAEDEVALEKQLDVSIAEFGERYAKVELMMKKGRLFTHASMEAAWNEMLAEWAKMAPPKLDPWDALVQAIIGKAVELLSGPGGLASYLRRQELDARLAGPSLPLDIGYSKSVPAPIRKAVRLRARRG